MCVCVCVCVCVCARACARVCARVCMSGDMSPYCSAHDESHTDYETLHVHACMSRTILPTMCQILVVTQLPNYILKVIMVHIFSQIHSKRALG